MVVAVIVGAGFGGIGVACYLLRAGIKDFVILEKSDNIGGVWNHNSYPDCGCDVPSHMYSFSFRLNPNWSEIYSKRDEIQSYLADTVDAFNLRPHIQFNTEVVRARFDEARREWVVTVRDAGGASGEREVVGKALVSAQGGLHVPQVPAIAGIERFRGRVFHSARWDHGVDLRGKRVAVVGTGASAVQFVPRLVDVAGKVVVFQRTANWVPPRLNGRFSAVYRFLLRWVPGLIHVHRLVVYLTLEFRWLMMTRGSLLNRFLTAAIKKYLEVTVKDPVLRAKLTPKIPLGCKRITPSDNYLQALQQPNAELVDSGIDSITETGIRDAQGVDHPADVIVLSTGFDLVNSVNYSVIGRGGLPLSTAIAADFSAHRATFFPRFPNFAVLSGPNSGLGHNSQVAMMESQTVLMMPFLRDLARGRIRSFEPRAEAAAAYNAAMQARFADKVWTAPGCASWYQVGEGPGGKKKVIALWPGTATEFWWRCLWASRDEYLLE